MILRDALALTLALSTLPACGGKCPDPQTPGPDQSRWEQELDQKRVLALQPGSKITIKRDVHNLTVSAEAGALADGFHRVMRDSSRRFGLIRVDRKPSNAGKAFTIGERFQGRYELDEAIKQKLKGKWRDWFGDLADEPPFCELLYNIENSHTSDYGIIARLDLNPPPGSEFVLAYQYLEGSPIAGSSTFAINSLGPGKSRLTQTFEYQELTEDFAKFFSTAGLRLHNQVVYSQVRQSAELVGGQIVESDIPREYQEL
jgi:hypothetical protein